ncbi:carbohydrate kinase [Aureimonas endophytica]|uniref:Carbohydrate kinase n=1 Tax=Aureimonas endophytica TaxID=2027858 RepID=A0A916ZGS5_9HYPH|nr:carbohydrate kinase [Aureimonas endophytica]GGD95928.1 carbohydrate kinase [Aureimonas endophytica]
MSARPAPRHVAVVDIGKTNAKLALHDLAAGEDLFVRTEPNAVRGDGPYPHYDEARLLAFLVDALADCAGRHPFEAISVTTHGASAALVGDTELALPILDYEYDGPESCREDYDRLRPDFAETLSPRLPNGLNVGAQLFWQERTFPEAFARARHVLCLPQYWAWRLSGVAAMEITSIACHTDLWAPRREDFSSLVAGRGWGRLFTAPLRSAFDALGPLAPDLARRIGLGAAPMPVHCGIHDSNASLLPHLLRHAPPFTVLSTGTWVVSFAVGGAARPIEPAAGILLNVDAFGRTSLSGRFMGGREFDRLTGGAPREPTPAEIAEVVEARIFALPTFVPGTGPFPDGAGRWSREPDGLSPGVRTAVASLYCAMVTAEMLALTGADGPTIVEGPFARNRLFLAALQAATGRAVVPSAGATGTTAGAALLAGSPPAAPTSTIDAEASPASGHATEALAAYAADWLAAARA